MVMVTPNGNVVVFTELHRKEDISQAMASTSEYKPVKRTGARAFVAPKRSTIDYDINKTIDLAMKARCKRTITLPRIGGTPQLVQMERAFLAPSGRSPPASNPSAVDDSHHGKGQDSQTIDHLRASSFDKSSIQNGIPSFVFIKTGDEQSVVSDLDVQEVEPHPDKYACMDDDTLDETHWFQLDTMKKTPRTSNFLTFQPMLLYGSPIFLTLRSDLPKQLTTSHHDLEMCVRGAAVEETKTPDDIINLFHTSHGSLVYSEELYFTSTGTEVKPNEINGSTHSACRVFECGIKTQTTSDNVLTFSTLSQSIKEDKVTHGLQAKTIDSDVRYIGEDGPDFIIDQATLGVNYVGHHDANQRAWHTKNGVYFNENKSGNPVDDVHSKSYSTGTSSSP